MTKGQDHTVIRLSICSHRTTLTDIDTAFETLRKYSERIDAEDREKLASDWANK